MPRRSHFRKCNLFEHRQEPAKHLEHDGAQLTVDRFAIALIDVNKLSLGVGSGEDLAENRPARRCSDLFPCTDIRYPCLDETVLDQLGR